MLVKERLTAALSEALNQLLGGDRAAAPPVRLDVPPTPDLGDFSTDVAIAASRAAGRPAPEIAESLAAHLRAQEGLVERVEVSASGVLNFRLASGWLEEAVREARTRREEFGRSQVGQDRRVQVEFVSAYPTAPLTVIHGRGAAVGDALANLLAWTGWRVTREFYVNDAGSRFDRFARSLEAEYLKQLGREDVRPPADGFQGDYLVEVVREIRERVGDRYLNVPAEERLKWLAILGRDAMLDRQRATLARFGVRFDEWRFESELLKSGILDEAFRRLAEKDLLYEADGALWLRSTSLGDEMDRPLRRSNGETTYLAGDLAYHLDKFQRGFDRVVDIWGPDHETYVARTLIGLQALGFPREAVNIRVLSTVTVRIDGGRVDAASTGNSLSLAEVIEELGPDSARFTYLLADATAALELNLDPARDSAVNPAQRVRSVLEAARRTVAAAQAEGRLKSNGEVAAVSGSEAEKLARRLADFPDEVRAAAQELDPSRIARYSVELAGLLEPALSDSASGPARPELLDAAAVVLGNALSILGCAPEAGE